MKVRRITLLFPFFFMVMLVGCVNEEKAVEAYSEQKKWIALTFDDGPGPYTEKLIKGLEQRGARATFFMLGEKIEQYPEGARLIIESENSIGNHTYKHIDLTNYSEHRIKEEIKKTSDYIVKLGGKPPTICRPPYGAYCNKVCIAVNSPIILWSVDTEDWRNTSAKKIAKHIIENSTDGDIVLLHELFESSVDGVFIAIDEMKKQGFEFVTVEELLTRNGEALESGKVYKCNKCIEIMD